MTLAVMDNLSYLEEKKFKIFLEMSEKKILNEVQRFRSELDNLKLDISSLRKEINYLKTNAAENKQTAVEQPTPQEQPHVQQQSQSTPTTRTDSKPQYSPYDKRPKQDDFKDGEITIEKFFYYGKR